MDDIKNNIDLECSSCFTDNRVNLSSDIKCKKCKESLSGKLYKSFVVSTGLILGVGAIGGAVIDDIVNFNRVSVKTEYKMMRQCLNRFHDRETCFCTVESMSGFLDAQRARLYGKEKLKILLLEHYEECEN